MTKIPIKYRVLIMIFILAVPGACQNKNVFEKNPAFDEKIVRLGDTVIAEVDGSRIYLSDVENAALAQGKIAKGAVLTPRDPVFQSVLDDLIDQRLLALEALKQGLDQNDDARRRLAMARERILASIVIEDLLAKAINDEAVSRIYNQQKKWQSKNALVRARLIVTDSKEQALELKKQAEKNGNFAALAKKYSKDESSRDLGGDLGYFSRDSVEKEIAKQAFALKQHEISPPFKTDAGWNILYLVGSKQPQQTSLADAKDDIVKYMTYEEIRKKLDELRTRSTIKLNTANSKDEAKN